MSERNSVQEREYIAEAGKKVNVFDVELFRWRDGLKPLRFSGFAHRFTRDGIVAIYHSLTHQVVYLNADIHQQLQEKVEKRAKLAEEDRQILSKLIKQGFVVSQGYEENKIIREICSRFLGKPVFGILYLLLTDICNLRCRYCFIEGAIPLDHTFSQMTEETAIRGLNFFAGTLKRNPEDRKAGRPSIIFYGGEPLLNQTTFFASLKEIARLKEVGELPSITSLSLNTNATVLSKDIIDNIAQNRVAVSVSLDGPKDLHDANRKFANKKGTFQKVLRNIRRLQEAGVKLSISCTINPQNIDHLEEVFQWMVREFQLKGLGFNMLLDLPGVAQSDAEYAREASERIIACYQIAREMGVYEDRIMRKVRVFVQHSLHLTDCGGYGNQLVIAPNGRIGPCHAYMSSAKFFPGSVDDPIFDPFHDPVFMEWSRRSPFSIQECHFCEAIGLCGGGCAYNADLKLGSVWDIDPNFCIHSKKILKWLIWDLFQKTIERR